MKRVVVFVTLVNEDALDLRDGLRGGVETPGAGDDENGGTVHGLGKRAVKLMNTLSL